MQLRAGGLSDSLWAIELLGVTRTFSSSGHNEL